MGAAAFPSATAPQNFGNWAAISGIGGLGHMPVQYAREMGLNIAAVDIDDGKLALAKCLGAT